MIKSHKHIFVINLLFLFSSTLLSQNIISGQKDNGSRITENSVIYYTDICTFYLPELYNTDYQEFTWHISMREQNKIMESNQVKYAEIISSLNTSYTICLSELFQKEIPQNHAGYYWETDPKTGYIHADIMCEITDKNNQKTSYSLPLYLKLSPDKPVVKIIKMEEIAPDNYDITVEPTLPETSPPIQGQWTITIYADDAIVSYYFDKQFSWHNNFFEKIEDGFIISASNNFGSTESDFISVKAHIASKDINTNTNLYIFPNPVKETLYLQTGNNKSISANIIIFDNNGKLVKKEYITFGQDIIPINTTRLIPGNYFLQISEESGKKKIFHFFKIP